MYKFGLSSTIEKEVKVYILNQHIVKGEMLDIIVDEMGNRVIIESIASFSSLSDSIMEKVMIVAVAPVDLRAGIAVLLSLAEAVRNYDGFNAKVLISEHFKEPLDSMV